MGPSRGRCCGIAWLASAVEIRTLLTKWIT
jgi:hypothetical protein